LNISDIYKDYEEQIIAARQLQQCLIIRGGDTKYFYGRKTEGEILDTRSCSGIINYEPTELVITAYAGTPISKIMNVLDKHSQMLAFDPPCFGEAATIGGMVACGLSGPRRPYVGSVRDFILGIKCLTGRGETLSFGGQVMKNVAGYDVSRLMTGAMGTLGLLLEISIKVLPKPEYEISLVRKSDFHTALNLMNTWAGQPLPLSAACFEQNNLCVRVSGKHAAVDSAVNKLVGTEIEDNTDYWQRLREHKLDFFRQDSRYLWRLSVPSMTPAITLSGDWLIDWGGAQRWLKSDEPVDRIRELTRQAGGHATLFRRKGKNEEIFQPLDGKLRQLHKSLKQAFDPDRIFNRGRMYRDI
jgi:glycolate oxidase FAD binding subunit